MTFMPLVPHSPQLDMRRGTPLTETPQALFDAG
jgi:hypothetical protein